MVTWFFSLVALLSGLAVGLLRPAVVFGRWRAGLPIFRRFDRTRRIGVAVVLAASLAAVIAGEPPLGVLGLAWAFALFAVLFDLEALFPALNRVEPVEPAEAALDADEPVLVLEVGGQSRAYPIRSMLMPRHLVHDEVGGVPVLVSWCALCRSGAVFRSEVSGHRLRFRVVGVFRRNLIMEDDDERTLWQQATGEALAGPHAGQRLELMPSSVVPWRVAKLRPGLTVARAPASASPAPFSTRLGLAALERATETVTAPGLAPVPPILPPRATVFGVVVDGAARAYPESSLVGTFTDTVGAVELELVYDPDASSLSARRTDRDEVIPVERSWWLGWAEFHPDGDVYAPAPGPEEPLGR